MRPRSTALVFRCRRRSRTHWRKLRPLLGKAVEPACRSGVTRHNGQRGPAGIRASASSPIATCLAGATRWRAASRPRIRSLHALRLCIAAGGTPQAIDAIFDWIWAQGHAGDSVDALAPLIERLGIDAASRRPCGESQLRATQRARYMFGVPTLDIDDALFWGNNAHDFAMATLRDGVAGRRGDAAGTLCAAGRHRGVDRLG